MPMKIFLSEITEDKYRNETIIKFPVFSASHVVKASLEDWSTLKSCISAEDLAVSMEGLPQQIECGNLHYKA